MVLVLTGLVAFYLVAATVFVIVVEIVHPGTDVSKVTESLDTMITAILGALLGLIAGRSEEKS